MLQQREIHRISIEKVQNGFTIERFCGPTSVAHEGKHVLQILRQWLANLGEDMGGDEIPCDQVQGDQD